MKCFKKLSASILAGLFVVGFTACSLPFDLPFFNKGGDTDIDKTVKVEKISSDLLDGKVANLLSANGLGLQKKEAEQGATAQPTKAMASSNLIVAKADEPIKQPIHELVKSSKDGIHDVRFHEKGKGSYREWNKKFNKHHHKAKECPHADCDEISDEIEAEEQQGNTPTILSLGARVNKLYNGGDYTFVCITSAVEGNIQVFTETSMEQSFEAKAFGGMYPTLINLTDRENGRPSLSYLTFGNGDDKGMILVRRSQTDTGYHQANYWSDNYNQSYIIDNATGKTYSLAQFPYIYSVTGNLFTVWKGGVSKSFDYYTVSVENDQLKCTKLVLPQEEPYNLFVDQEALVDIYGNVVFQTRMEIHHMAQLANATLENALVEELRYPQNKKIIFTGYNQECINGDPSSMQNGWYKTSYRYFKGSDGKIYNVGFKGSFNNIPVKVLDENGDWIPVPNTTSITFAPYTGYIVGLGGFGMASMTTFFTINEIDGGYAYFSNTRWGEPAGHIHGGGDLVQMQAQFPNEPLGVIKLPVAGNSDESMENVIKDDALLELNAKLASQNENYIYRTGNHSIVYKDGTNLVLWNRKTDVKSTIENVTGNLEIENAQCFKIMGKYIPFGGVDFEWTLENLPTAPIEEQAIALDAFYALLRN